MERPLKFTPTIESHVVGKFGSHSTNEISGSFFRLLEEEKICDFCEGKGEKRLTMKKTALAHALYGVVLYHQSMAKNAKERKKSVVQSAGGGRYS